MSDTDRPSPTKPDWLTLSTVQKTFETAGLPRTIRTLQRYCASGMLEAAQEMTPSGMTYFVNPASIEPAIVQLRQMHAIDEARHSPTMSDIVVDTTKPKVGTDVVRPSPAKSDNDASEESQEGSATRPDMSAAVASSDARYVARLEHDLERAEKELDIKNQQISEFMERGRESNHLFLGLQNLLSNVLKIGDGRQQPTPPAGDTPN